MSPQLTDGSITFQSLKKAFKPKTGRNVELFSTDIDEVDSIKNASASLVYLRPKINDLRHINKHLILINNKLQKHGLLVCQGETIEQRNQRIKQKYGMAALLFYPIDFFYKRIAPKIGLLKKLYFYVSNGRNRVLSKAEVLGRIHFCGFHLIKMEDIDNRLHLIVKKTHEPCTDKNPSYGPFYRKKALGKNGKPVYIYKFRTMHPYSEYLRDFILRTNGYAKSGNGIAKIDQDFRVTGWGRFLRKYWLDELPQIINLIKGDLKIVGVRPVSSSFQQEYPSEFLKERIRHKLGLLPPYAAHIHQSVQEYIESEQKYLSAYNKHPILTDVRYFFWISYNIITNKIRSQ